MIRGIDASRNGMQWEQIRTDVIANNVANINTDGFRRSVAVGKEFGDMLLRRIGDQQPSGPVIGHVGSGAVVDEIVQDKTESPLRSTGRTLDAALVGPGEFTVQGAGGLTYTRDGRFERNAAGVLVTAKGDPVLVNGAPVGAGATTLTIEDGGVIRADGVAVGSLDLRGGTADTHVTVGMLEASTTDLSAEMTDLITALRGFQINQRALQIQDQTLSKAVSDLANI